MMFHHWSAHHSLCHGSQPYHSTSISMVVRAPVGLVTVSRVTTTDGRGATQDQIRSYAIGSDPVHSSAVGDARPLSWINSSPYGFGDAGDDS